MGSGFSRIDAADTEIRLKPDPTDRPLALGHAAALSLLAPAARTVRVRIGGDETPVMPMTSAVSGHYTLQFDVGGRIALDLDGPLDAGYQLVGDELRALPPGSTFDAASGMFAWQPPVPFLGPFRLVFTAQNERIDVRATIVDPTVTAPIAMHIDTPAADRTVASSFVIAGWALDPLAATGSGVDTLHVWAYRRDAIAAPQFLGAAAVGGFRADVASAFGPQFERPGFTLTTPDLAPGVYDLVVYPWSHRTGRFEPAESVRVTIR